MFHCPGAAALLAAVTATGLALGCTSQAGPAASQPPAGAAPATQAGAQPRLAADQRLTVALTGVGESLDPNLARVPTTYFNRAIFERAVRVEGRDIKPMLAESWRLVTPTTWEFKVREARWANGDPVTAEDLVFSHQIASTPDTPYRTTFTRVYNVVDRMTSVDAKTFTVHTKFPEAILPNRMSLTQIFSRKVFEQAGSLQKFGETPVGSGPWRVKSFAPKREIVLERNPAYVGPERPTLTEIRFVEILEPAARLAALQTGDVDVIENIPLDEIDRLKGFGAKPVVGVIDIVSTVTFDVFKGPELQSRDVRYALNLAVDRKAMIRALKKGLVPEANQPVLSTVFGHNPDLPNYPYDPARARDMIARAGFPNGFTLPLEYNIGFPGYDQMALAVSAELRKIGITAEPRGIDPGRYFALLQARQLGPWQVGGIQSQVIADVELTNQLSPGLPGSAGVYSNPEFDRLYQAQLQEFDRSRREALLRQIMKLLHEDPPAIYLWGFDSPWAVKEKVDGFAIQSNGFMGWDVVRILQP